MGYQNSMGGIQKIGQKSKCSKEIIVNKVQKSDIQLYFVTKINLTHCEKHCSSDREKLLKFIAEGREFAEILISLEHFFQTVKGQNNFW